MLRCGAGASPGIGVAARKLQAGSLSMNERDAVGGEVQVTIVYAGDTKEARELLHHHAVLRRGVERRVGALCDAVENGVRHEYEPALASLQTYLTAEILPHGEAEERTLYRAAVTEAPAGELVHVLEGEHLELAELVKQLAAADSRTAATISEWIATFFAGHVAKENDLLLSALTSSGANLAALVANMRQQRPSR